MLPVLVAGSFHQQQRNNNNNCNVVQQDLGSSLVQLSQEMCDQTIGLGRARGRPHTPPLPGHSVSFAVSSFSNNNNIVAAVVVGRPQIPGGQVDSPTSGLNDHLAEFTMADKVPSSLVCYNGRVVAGL
jgi:hypothetical protein